MSKHYAGSCPPGQHCCLCAEDELHNQLVAAEECKTELASRVHEIDAARTERIVELEQQLAAAELDLAEVKFLHENQCNNALTFMRERDEALAQLAAAEARIAELESRPIKNMGQIVREFSEHTEPSKKEVGDEVSRNS